MADVVDHIAPLALGGMDVDDNTQPLCNDCHDVKTSYENASSEAASFHPGWLKPSAVPLTIVCGPPCSGKSTYVQENAQPFDLIIDLDTIMMTLDPSYLHWSNSLHRSLLLRAVRVRNALLGSLSRRSTGSAWFIVSAPSEAERQWWIDKLGGSLVLLCTDLKECKARALRRGTPLASDGVDAWDRASRSPWVKPEAKVQRVAIGIDGWPKG